MTQIIECVPNFSEGRSPEVIKAIRERLTSVRGAYLLHETSDADHNRTVMTLAGTPDAVLEAVYLGIEIAAKLIDLRKHSGVHPRIGATDVVPFVPMENITMDECVQLARKLGQRVGSELNLPVYLYAEAAIRPERKSLAYLRRGQYEALVYKISEADRYPDYGPATMPGAGAVTIGARKPLIAYNVYLSTNDVTIAQTIARAIRGSSGGLTGVQALGFLVDGRAQVSMNLIDYERTPLYRVMEFIRIEAEKLNTQISESELIGLMPQDAIIQSMAWYLQLPSLSSGDLLENQINSIKQGF